MLSPKFRLEHFHEAENCLREALKCSIEDPELQVNLLAAIANSIMACTPDSVAAALITESMQEEMARKHVRKKVREAQGER